MANKITYVPQIDYTSRDYLSIRNDLLDLISFYAPKWTSRDPSDLGIAMIELFAYMGDSINFYIDRAANEGFIGTASQRDSILQLATMFGYSPNKISAATTILEFTNSGASDQVIPAGTLFAVSAVTNSTSNQVFFESDAEVTVPAGGTATVTATEGLTIANEELGSSNGAPRQVFKLGYPYVIDKSVVITVNNTKYTYVSSLLDYGMVDYVFSTYNDADGNTYVVFGDGINGIVPPAAGRILVTYRTGAGSVGNVPAATITHQMTNVVGGVSVKNTIPATGGSDEESTESIRSNAPKALRSLDRAISLRDYSSLALRYPGVAKAVAAADSPSSVNLYVSPTGDPGTVGNATTAAFNALAEELYLYFVDKALPGSSITILPPTYVGIDIAMTVHVLPQYKQSTVISDLMTALKLTVAVENSFFADIIPVQYLMKAAAVVQGIDYVTVDVLKRSNPISVSYWIQNGTTVTIVTSPQAHGLSSSQTAYIDLITATPNVEGSWSITATPTGNTLTFTTAASAQSTSANPGTSTTTTRTFSSPNTTITTASNHNLAVGQRVVISGVTPTAYNGVWTTQTGTTGTALVINTGSDLSPITTAGKVVAVSPVVPTQTPTGTIDITLTTTSVHGIVEGQKVTVSGVTPTAYNGVWTAKAGTTGTTLILDIGSNPGAITTAGTVTPYIGTVNLWQGVDTITCAVNEIPAEGTFVLTPTGGIS